jgi:RNA ligase partner protein
MHLQETLDRPIKVVIDTSLFVNPEVRYRFGENPTEAFSSFLQDAKRLKTVQFYMPPLVFEELQHFIEIDRINTEDLFAIVRKSPKRHELMCPAHLLYEYIEEMRDRVNKGLRIAEKAVRETTSGKIDEIIQDLRRKYRDALREGIIDSREDVDMLLLAMELDAFLISADKGLVKWADRLGIRWIFSGEFADFMNHVMEQSLSQ